MDDPTKLGETDHRRLAKELDLYVTSDLVGSGLPMFTPRGTVLREELINYSNELRQKRGFERVWTPHITKTDLYKKSGHWDKFGAELFLVKSQETDDEMVLKPMNCPHHIQVYASKPRSYRDMPIKYLETATVYRDEKKGELMGLLRVRSINMDDSHVFCRPDQIEQSVKELIEAAQELYKTIGMDLKFRLSFRDSGEGYLGSPELWDKAQGMLEKIAKAEGLDYITAPGDAAFYGPKIDFLATDSLERTHQVATVQLDFVQPERFELTYINEQGKSETPVMIHCALLGSIERFLGVYIEHTAGKFPVWLAPEQLRVATLNDDQVVLKKAQEIIAKAKELGIRAELDSSNQSVGKKIHDAEIMKVPSVLVIGSKEVENGSVQPRTRVDLKEFGSQTSWSNYEDFLQAMSEWSKARK